MSDRETRGGIRPEVVLDEGVAARVRAVALWIDGIVVEKRDDAFDELNAVARRHRESNRGRTVGQVDGVGEARRLYRGFGIDPTSTRPSSEALLKRSLKGSELYHLSNVVDVGNAVSLATLLPLGLYDRDAIDGELAIVREGADGEEFPGIRKGPVHVGGRLCVADALGAFGSPTSDSFRTRVTDDTSRLLVIVFAPVDGELERLAGAGDRLVEAFADFAGGTTVRKSLLA